MMIYVDAGKHECGVAEFFERTLVSAKLWSSAIPLLGHWPGASTFTKVLCEIPQVYAHARPGALPHINVAIANDLIDVSIAAGTVTAGTDRTFVRPAQWKGQQPKEAQHRKMWRALQLEGGTEANLLLRWIEGVRTTKGKDSGCVEDIFDAVCLGLVHNGRI